jgi:hypothetical protein
MIFLRASFLLLVVTIFVYKNAQSFSPSIRTPTRRTAPIVTARSVRSTLFPRATLALNAQGNNDVEELSESDQTLLGAAGTIAALVTLYSEFTLKTTGCGLPAGPFGMVGLIEGVSYLGIVGVAAYSLYTTKTTKTGKNGLPGAGRPAGLLGAAQGLSYLSIVIGLVVAVLQVTDYGYIPNAVPMQGGMCS